MDTIKDAGGGSVPIVADVATAANGNRSWVRRHAWPLGGAAALMTLGGWWWRRRRRRRLDVGPVTEQWLEAHEYEAGQAGDQD